jgi:hypothetical protein
MRGRYRAAVIAAVMLGICGQAFAAGGRPWLCRDKPVFSSTKPMNYTVSSDHAGSWRVFLMQFTPGGGHDGFDIAKTIEVPGNSSDNGTINPGRYFAVALYRDDGEWICPGHAEDQHAPGTIGTLCFSRYSEGCGVKFTVTDSQ